MTTVNLDRSTGGLAPSANREGTATVAEESVAKHGNAERGTLGRNLNALRAGVLGANDGIISVAALLMGVVASGVSETAVMTAGLAATVAGAVSMSLGEYVSVSSQSDSEKQIVEQHEREHEAEPDGVLDEVATSLKGFGIAPTIADEAVKHMRDDAVVSAHLKLTHGVDKDEITSPIEAAVSSAISFILGAALPMLAVWLAPMKVAALAVFAVTLVALALTGFISAKLSETNVVRAVLRLVIGGALGLAVTYGVGALFGVAV